MFDYSVLEANAVSNLSLWRGKHTYTRKVKSQKLTYVQESKVTPGSDIFTKDLDWEELGQIHRRNEVDVNFRMTRTHYWFITWETGSGDWYQIQS